MRGHVEKLFIKEHINASHYTYTVDEEHMSQAKYVKNYKKQASCKIILKSSF